MLSIRLEAPSLNSTGELTLIYGDMAPADIMVGM
jgi:hypothetical protein